MTMLERCARAVKDARALSGTNPVARLSDVDRRVARAVLEALKEPTPEMVREGVYTDDFATFLDDAPAADAVKRIFTAMLTQALKDHP